MPAASSAVVEYEPDEEEILAELLPRYVDAAVRALLEREASEQGASMTAMDNATRNAGDLINRSPSSITAAVRPRSPPNSLKSSPARKRSKDKQARKASRHGHRRKACPPHLRQGPGPQAAPTSGRRSSAPSST
jgi:hypothetical protein